MEKKTLGEYTETIDKLIKENSFDIAYHHAVYLLRQFPKHLTTYKQLGRISLEQGHFDRGIEFYLRVLAVEPVNYRNYLAIAIAYQNKKEFRRAYPYAALAECLNPGSDIAADLTLMLQSHASETFLEDVARYKRIRNHLNSQEFDHAKKHFEALLDPGLKLLTIFHRAIDPNTETAIDLGSLETVLDKAPYCRKILTSLLTAYAIFPHRPKFQQCADRLTELNPEKIFRIGEDGRVEEHTATVRVNYHDWTGFPNTRAGSFWHATQARYVKVEENSYAQILDLIPILSEFVYVPDEPQEFQAEFNAESPLKNSERPRIVTSPDDDKFFQEDYFKTQSISLSKTDSSSLKQTKPQPVRQSPVTALDEAFSFIEKVATEGFDLPAPNPSTRPIEAIKPEPVVIPEKIVLPIRPTMKPELDSAIPSPSEQIHGFALHPPTSAPVIAPSAKPTQSKPQQPDETRSDDAQPYKPTSNETGKESPEIDPEETPEDEKTRLRAAWNAFSMGKHDDGVRAYRKLIDDRVQLAKVKNDLNTLKILYPEIVEIDNLCRYCIEQEIIILNQ